MATLGKMISAIGKYKKVDLHSSVLGATPHRLVQLLFDGALARIVEAQGHMHRRDPARKGEAIGRSLDIINGLRGALNLEAGGELAAQLDSLYDYMARRLLMANLKNDPEALREVQELLLQLSSGWAGIRETVDIKEAPRAVNEA
jgi:flagellar protein FliS